MVCQFRLSNQKPSAIFRVRGIALDVDVENDSSMMEDSGDDSAAIGIAIEPFAQVEAQVAALSSHPSASTSNIVVSGANSAGPHAPSARLSDPVWLSERILSNLFNYLSSFTDVGPDASKVDLAVIQKWYESFTSKLKAGGPSFLERSD